MPHILIIEDEPLIAMELESILADEGGTSFSFADSEDAAIVAALAQPPALITSDVKLLTGTGPHAVKTIHEKLGPIPVIFITATPDACRPCNPPGLI